MHAKRMLLAALLLALAGGAVAQKVYRSVGPDGKVVFSDAPPPDRDAVLLKAGRVPEGAAAGKSQAAASAAPDHGGAWGASGTKQAKKAAAPAEVAPAAGGPSPEAVQAAARSLGVLTSMEMLVKSFEDTCLAALPTSARKYSGAAEGWRDRHAQLLGKRDAALAHLTAAQRRVVAADGRAFAQRMMQPVHQGDSDQRIKWCDHSADEIAAGKLDKHQDPKVKDPLDAIAAR